MKLLMHTCCAPCSVYCIKKLPDKTSSKEFKRSDGLGWRIRCIQIICGGLWHWDECRRRNKAGERSDRRGGRFSDPARLHFPPLPRRAPLRHSAPASDTSSEARPDKKEWPPDPAPCSPSGNIFRRQWVMWKQGGASCRPFS